MNKVLQAREKAKITIETDFLHYQQEVVAVTVGGLNVYEIALTKRHSAIPYSKKKCMYILARQHAAETHGSLIMKYLI